MVDALSRSFEVNEEEVLFSSKSEVDLGSLLALSLPIYSLLEELKSENLNNPAMHVICSKLSGDDSTVKGFEIKGGHLFFKDKYYAPENSSIIPKILWEFHDSILGGHTGVQRTLKRVSEHFFGQR